MQSCLRPFIRSSRAYLALLCADLSCCRHRRHRISILRCMAEMPERERDGLAITKRDRDHSDFVSSSQHKSQSYEPRATSLAVTFTRSHDSSDVVPKLHLRITARDPQYPLLRFTFYSDSGNRR